MEIQAKEGVLVHFFFFFFWGVGMCSGAGEKEKKLYNLRSGGLPGACSEGSGCDASTNKINKKNYCDGLKSFK